VLLEAALAAPAGVDLRLDDDDGVAGLALELERRVAGLGRAEHDLGLGHGDAELTQQGLGLVLVDLHVAAWSFP
jgi:hypothetical protein